MELIRNGLELVLEISLQKYEIIPNQIKTNCLKSKQFTVLQCSKIRIEGISNKIR